MTISNTLPRFPMQLSALLNPILEENQDPWECLRAYGRFLADRSVGGQCVADMSYNFVQQLDETTKRWKAYRSYELPSHHVAFYAGIVVDILLELAHLTSEEERSWWSALAINLTIGFV